MCTDDFRIVKHLTDDAKRKIQENIVTTSAKKRKTRRAHLFDAVTEPILLKLEAERNKREKVKRRTQTAEDVTDSRYKDNTEDSQWYAELCRGLEQTGALEKALTKMEIRKVVRATRSKILTRDFTK